MAIGFISSRQVGQLLEAGLLYDPKSHISADADLAGDDNMTVLWQFMDSAAQLINGDIDRLRNAPQHKLMFGAHIEKERIPDRPGLAIRHYVH